MAQSDCTARPGNATGLTALEIMIVLSMIVMTLLLTAPSLRDYRANQRMKSALAAFTAALGAARSEAVHRGGQVVLCPVSENANCRRTLQGSAEWQGGWLIFEDRNGDREHQPHEPVLRSGPPLDGIRVLGSRHRDRLRFFPNGTAPGSNASITFCDARGASQARQLSLSASGRIRAKTTAESDGGACEA